MVCKYLYSSSVRAVYELPFASRYLYRKPHITAYKSYIIIYKNI